MLGAESLHQLDVHGLVAVGSEDTQVSLTPVEKIKISESQSITALQQKFSAHVSDQILGNEWRLSSKHSVEGAKLSSQMSGKLRNTQEQLTYPEPWQPPGYREQAHRG